MSVIAFRTKTVVRWTRCWAAGGCLGRWWGQEGRVAWARCGGLLSGKDAGASQTAGRFSSHPVCSEVKSHIDMTLTFLVCYSGWCWAKSSGGDSLGDLPGLTQPCPGTCLSGAGTGWGCGSSQHRLWGQESHFRNSSAHFSLFHWLLQGQQEAQLPTFLRLKHAFLLLLPFRWQKELVPGPLSTGEWHPISPTLLKNLEAVVAMLIYLVLLDENCNNNSADAVQNKTFSCCSHHSSASFEENNLFMPVQYLAAF